MKCNSCGAPLKKGQLTCRYCGSVVPEEDLRRFRQDINAMDQKINTYNKQLKNNPRTKTKRIILIVVVFITILIIYAMSKPIFHHFQSKSETKKLESLRDQLETYYVTGDYENLFICYQENDEPQGRQFTKYSELNRINNKMSSLRGDIEALVQASDDSKALERAVDSGLRDSFQILYQTNIWMNDSSVYGNEDKFIPYIEEVNNYFENTLLLSDLEIEELSSYAISDYSSYDDEQRKLFSADIAARLNK